MSGRRKELVARESIPGPVLIHLADALSVPDGGFSVSVEQWRDARTGYAVSIFPECEERITEPDLQARIAQYLATHAPLLGRPDVVLGGWRNPEDDAVYLDVSIVIPTRAQAVALAHENRQVAVWDFAACKSILLNEREDSPMSNQLVPYDPATTSLEPRRLCPRRDDSAWQQSPGPVAPGEVVE